MAMEMARVLVRGMGTVTEPSLSTEPRMGEGTATATACGVMMVCRDAIYRKQWERALRAASGPVEVEYVIGHMLESEPTEPERRDCRCHCRKSTPIGNGGLQDLFFGNGSGCSACDGNGDGAGAGNADVNGDCWGAGR
jgi:hypothetical protein